MEKCEYIRLAPSDQRLCIQGSTFYLFDHSGATPWSTDDGALALLTDRPLVVEQRRCYARVKGERTGGEYTVSLGHEAALKLHEQLAMRGVALTFVSDVPEELVQLLTLCGGA